MKTNRKDLDTLFNLLKDVRPSQPDMTREEIRAVLGSSQVTGPIPHRNILNRRTGMTAIILSVLAGVAAFYATQDHESPHNSARQPSQIQSTVTAPRTHPETAGSPSPAADTDSPHTSTYEGTAAPESRPAYLRYDSAPIHEGRNTTSDHGEKQNSRAASIPEFSGDPPRDSVAPVHPTTIPGTRILELTSEEMAGLGITVRDNAVEVYGEDGFTLDTPEKKHIFHQLGFDTTHSSGVMRVRVTAGPRRIESRMITHMQATTISKVVPIIVSSDWLKNGETEASALVYFDESPLLKLFGMDATALTSNMFRHDTPNMEWRSLNERNSMLAARLIPIRIRTVQTEQEALEGGMGEYMLWYFPTEEFVEALPERYRTPLRKELELIADVESNTLTSGEVCQRLTGETFFDYCRRSSGSLSVASVYPNPSKGDVTCRFSLKSGRTLSMALYDISGRHLRDLTQAQWMEQGDHDMALKMDGAKSGAYLIVIKTSEDEQVVQRVIVE